MSSDKNSSVASSVSDESLKLPFRLDVVNENKSIEKFAYIAIVIPLTYKEVDERLCKGIYPLHKIKILTEQEYLHFDGEAVCVRGIRSDQFK